MIRVRMCPDRDPTLMDPNANHDFDPNPDSGPTPDSNPHWAGRGSGYPAVSAFAAFASALSRAAFSAAVAAAASASATAIAWWVHIVAG